MISLLIVIIIVLILVIWLIYNNNNIKNDIDKLSFRKFKAKWDMNKQLVVKYIKENKK